MKGKKKNVRVDKTLIDKVIQLNPHVPKTMSQAARNKHLAVMVGCSDTTVRRILTAWGDIRTTRGYKEWMKTLTGTKTVSSLILSKYRENNDEAQLKRMYKQEEGEEVRANIIRIEKGVPIPQFTNGSRNRLSKYDFLQSLEIGDSFVINGNMPDYCPKSAQSVIYEKAKKLGMTVTMRTLEGRSNNPTKIRIWRTA